MNSHLQSSKLQLSAYGSNTNICSLKSKKNLVLMSEHYLLIRNKRSKMKNKNLELSSCLHKNSSVDLHWFCMDMIKMTPCGCFLWDCTKKQQGNKRIAGTPCSIGVLKDQSCPWGLGTEKCFFYSPEISHGPYTCFTIQIMMLASVIIRTVKLKVHFLI